MESPMPKPATSRELATREETCATHGVFESVNYVGARWSGCPTCAKAEREEQKRKADAAERRERTDARMAISGIQGRFLSARFDNFEAATPEQGKVLDTCRQYAANVGWKSGSGLWMIGPPGTGKTHLGCAMVRHVIEDRDAEAAIYSGREIIRMLRSTWSKSGSDRTMDGRATSEEGLINDLGWMPLLVIDEIGVGFGSEGEQVQLFDIIDLRYKHQRPTVLLSNLTAKEVKQTIGERAYDRLREGAQVVACGWPSHRGNRGPRQSLEAVK